MVFLDIFSKEKIKEKIKNTIIVDNREKNSLVISELINLGNKVEFKQLLVGDYIVNNIAIERKTSDDLISSILDKRLFEQLKNLKQYPEHALIIEQSNQNRLVNENVFKGIVLSIALKFKIPLIYSKNERDTAKYLNLLANKNKKREESIRAKKKTNSKEEQIQYILEGFPNIGPVKAKSLIKEFKTLKHISNASKLDLEKVIGKNAEEVYDLFNQELQF